MENGKNGSWNYGTWHFWSLVAMWENYNFSPQSLVNYKIGPCDTLNQTDPLLLSKPPPA